MDQSNSVHLRWNKHQATLVSVFDALLDSEKLTDCTISAEGQHLRAHKIILSACSPYFEELFAENYEKHPIIILPDVKYDVVKAVMDFMYRGEINLTHEKLNGVLKLSESLQIRGLSGSGCLDGIDMQKGNGRNAPPVPQETHPYKPASVSCLPSGQNEAEEKMQSFRGCSPTVLSQEGSSAEVASISKTLDKRRKSINHSDSDLRTAQNTSEEVITTDLVSVRELAAQRQLLPATCNSTGRPAYTPMPLRSVCTVLQSPSGDMADEKNERFSINEEVSLGTKSANLIAHKQEVPPEIKSELVDSHVEIVENLTMDDGDNYHYDNVDMQKGSGRNAAPVPPETLPSQPASGQNEPEKKVQSFRGHSPAVLFQEEGSVEVDSISKSIQKYRKSLNHSAFNQRVDQETFEGIVTTNHDNVHQPLSQRQVLPTTCNLRAGPVYSPIRALKTLVSCAHTTICSSSCSPIPCHSVCSELQSFNREMAVEENEQFLIPETVLRDKSSTNHNAHLREISLKIKSEVPENHREVVDDLTLDDDDNYLGARDYRDNFRSVEVDAEEVRRVSEGLTYKENFCTQGINNLHSLFGSVDVSNMTLTTSQTVLHYQFSCHSCGKSYQHAQGLQRHRKQCGKEPRYQCPRCSYRCARSDNLKTHMASRRCLMHEK